ncbi:MAG: MFS transporter, partial [Anaerotardibacter sp.]
MTDDSQTNKTEYATGGYKLPGTWLSRIVLIWGGNAISAFAGSAASFAAIWFITETTGSPLYIAGLYVLAFLPMGLLSPFGGVIADKYNRKAIIIICDAILTLTGIGTALWIALLGPSVAAVMFYCASWGFASAFRAPAFNATMPFLVPERHLMRINSLDTLLGSISMIAAPALGILLYAAFGLQASILLGGFGSLCAVLTMLLAKLPKIIVEEQTAVVKSLKEGVSALGEQKGLLVLTVAVSLGLFAYGPIDSLLPLMVNSQFGGDGFAASLLAAIMGAGMFVGAIAL